jgi:divalent metal cation (Fe/Co/Zn/Cd) transporter
MGSRHSWQAGLSAVASGYGLREMSAIDRPAERLIHQARLAETLTLAWMAVELLVALWAGIAARSVALTTFGVDSGIELFTAAVVLRLFVLHTERATGQELDARERQASRLVGWGLYGLIAYILATSVWSLASGSRPESSPIGIALAVAALAIMPLLWRWRIVLARRLGSPALRADAACSLVCIFLSAVLLAGLALNSLFGWWWADSVAALAMIWWIRGEAREALAAARTGRHDED